jgi:DNA/RNA-binding domain of Phe-tRNA-synthetase-like protein
VPASGESQPSSKSEGAPVPEIAPEIRSSVRLGLIHACPVSIGPTQEALQKEIDDLCSSLAAEHAGKPPSEIPGLNHARDLYRTFGIDPTKNRPSSESLLRRVIKKKPFPKIFNAVDLCNYFALRFLLSLGLYDADKIKGEVVFRPGKQGESFAGIRKDQVHVGGRPVLVDQEGPFGNPTSDSLRTSVTDSTRSLWMVIFAPQSFPKEKLEEHVRTSCEYMAKHLAPTGEEVMTQGTIKGAGF